MSKSAIGDHNLTLVTTTQFLTPEVQVESAVCSPMLTELDFMNKMSIGPSSELNLQILNGNRCCLTKTQTPCSSAYVLPLRKYAASLFQANVPLQSEECHAIEEDFTEKS